MELSDHGFAYSANHVMSASVIGINSFLLLRLLFSSMLCGATFFTLFSIRRMVALL